MEVAALREAAPRRAVVGADLGALIEWGMRMRSGERSRQSARVTGELGGERQAGQLAG